MCSGWGELGYHNPEAGDDIQTPVIDALIKNEALELDRYYGKQVAVLCAKCC